MQNILTTANAEIISINSNVNTYTMIPCQQLRIGNFVMADQKPRQIAMIRQQPSVAALASEDTSETATEHTLDSLSPVPLSDELLKQCGFVYHNYFKFWQLIEGEAPDRSEMDMDRDYNILDFMRKPVFKKVASLHQLQNIYFLLKGKELAVGIK